MPSITGGRRAYALVNCEKTCYTDNGEVKRSVNPMRERIEGLLSGTGAFLRCDRGGALYVTNLPARCDHWRESAQAMRAAEFLIEERGTLLAVTPNAPWIGRYCEWAAERCCESELTRLFRQSAAQRECGEETRAWLEGIKRLELHCGVGDYERTVRQAAAVALRKQCGGALRACGLCLDMLREGIEC